MSRSLNAAFAAAVLAGCPPPAPNPLCPADPIVYPAACAETTAPPPETTTTYGSMYGYGPARSGAGTLVAVGDALSTVPGSAALDGFEVCGAAHDHQVRVEDEDGETWTFGWDVDGAVDDGSLDALTVGDTVDFYAVWRFLGYSVGSAIVLADADGPLFVLELNQILDDAQRGGVGVASAGECSGTSDGRAFDFTEIEFTWADGSTQLWPGDDTTIALPNRSVSWLLGDASYLQGCLDGCGETWWAGWAEPER